MRDPLPTKEELLPEIIKAIRNYGVRSFTDVENTMTLNISNSGGWYQVAFIYKWVTYKFFVDESDFQEGVPA